MTYTNYTNYTIIEDCSPYFIRFTHKNIEKFVKLSQHFYETTTEWKGVLSDVDPNFSNYRSLESSGRKLLNFNQVHKDLPLNTNRANFFVSQATLKWRAHIDGHFEKFGINYAVKLLDDVSETCWYDDKEVLSNYEIYEYDYSYKSEIAALNFDKSKHKPLATLKYKMNEAVLLNTGIFHDVDNSKSTNERIILTLRSAGVTGDEVSRISFLDARHTLFGF